MFDSTVKLYHYTKHKIEMDVKGWNFKVISKGTCQIISKIHFSTISRNI